MVIQRNSIDNAMETRQRVVEKTKYQQGRQSVLKSEGDRLENEEVRGYASLIF